MVHLRGFAPSPQGGSTSWRHTTNTNMWTPLGTWRGLFKSPANGRLLCVLHSKIKTRFISILDFNILLGLLCVYTWLLSRATAILESRLAYNYADLRPVYFILKYHQCLKIETLKGLAVECMQLGMLPYVMIDVVMLYS